MVIASDGTKFASFGNIVWFTNMDFKKRHDEYYGFRKYYDNPKFYLKYDNYDAIEVNPFKEIPTDYIGTMGIPITALGKLSPEQFEIIGMAKRGAGDPALKSKVYTKEDYPNYSDLNAGPTIWCDGVLKNTYPRILIRYSNKWITSHPVDFEKTHQTGGID